MTLFFGSPHIKAKYSGVINFTSRPASAAMSSTACLSSFCFLLASRLPILATAPAWIVSWSGSITLKPLWPSLMRVGTFGERNYALGYCPYTFELSWQFFSDLSILFTKVAFWLWTAFLSSNAIIEDYARFEIPKSVVPGRYGMSILFLPAFILDLEVFAPAVLVLFSWLDPVLKIEISDISCRSFCSSIFSFSFRIWAFSSSSCSSSLVSRSQCFLNLCS